ncbi:hypothetical protein [Saccharospirillum salsuginis]|uniref:Uncharacterized protein n=1 Tax=Saccharospirillum salsuginis TaxID=418750 RepID=A0A918NIQ6_9GAMM|nr:hypothetical protein [Saccharospirillum salsuginis]GGX73035.1 hypothetical protein GCM10007392_45570 [Saccharospirillum salsuginis]
MTDYNDQYYISLIPAGDEVLFPTLHDRSAKCRYRFRKYDISQGPIFFENCYREEDRKMGVNRDPLPDILVDSAELIVPPVFKEYLQRFPIYGMQFVHAIYVDDYDKWHDNRWAMNFYERIPALDVDNCEIDWEFSNPEESEYDVVRFSLSESVLNDIPEESRLVFKIGQSCKSYVMVHQKVKDFIDQAGFTGLRLIKVSEFEEGRQFKG